MNRIYKSIWNAVTRSWTAVSEITRTRRAKTGATVGVFMSTLLLLGMSGSVLAYSWTAGSDVKLDQNNGLDEGTVNHNFAFGTGEAAKAYDSVEVSGIFCDYKLIFSDNGWEASVDLDNDNLVTDLFNQSIGYDQILVSATDGIDFLWPISDDDFSVSNERVETNNDRWTQNITQKGKQVATATYLMGSQAHNLNGISWKKSYTENGIYVVDGGNTISTNAILTGLQLNGADGTPLSLTVSGEKDWWATLSGTGGIEYIGVNQETDIVNFSEAGFHTGIEDYDGDNLSGINNYTGKTGAQNVTLNLYRQDSLGQTSKVEAVNSIINVFNLDAWTTVNGLSYNRVETNFNSEQSSFIVQNESGEAAQFTDDNTVTAKGEFTYTVTGDMQIGDDSKAGSVTFDTNSQGSGVTLSVGKDLTINENSYVSGANQVIVNGQLNLHTVSGVDDSVSILQVGSTLNFDSINGGTYTHDTQHTGNGTFTVNVDNSIITYDENLKLDVGETNVIGSSHLTVNDVNLLGETVTFTDSQGQGVVTINGSENSPVDLSGKTFTNNRDANNAVIHVTGGLALEAGDLEGYNGWLRLGDMDFNLTQKTANVLNSSGVQGDASVGLSLGSGANLVVIEHLHLDKFGWADGGVLDLTNHQHDSEDEESPVLHVGEIYLGEGSIKLDPQEYVTAQGPQTGGSVLDYDNGQDSNRYFVITAESVVGSAAGIDIVDSEGNSFSDKENTTSNLYNPSTTNPGDGNVAAVAHWGYVVGSTNGQELDGERGVYISYGLTELELVGEQYNNRALVINLGDANDNELLAKVTGNGVINIISTDDGKKEVTFANTDNSFEGEVHVADGLTLTAHAGALSGNETDGGKVEVVLGEGSTLSISDSTQDQVGTQYLETVSAAGSSTVSISEGNTLSLTGDGSNLTGILQGTGTLQLQGGTASSTVEAVNGFDGVVEINGTDDNLGELTISVAGEDKKSITTAMTTDENGWLVKTGTGQLSFTSDTQTNSLGDVDDGGLNVRVNGGSVVLDEDTNFGKVNVENDNSLYVDGKASVDELSGAGHIYVDVKLGSEDNQGNLGQAGDGLVIGSATGNFTLHADAGESLGKGALESIRVMEVGETNNFNLTLDGQYLTSGAYSYQLVRNDTADGTNFDLTSYTDGNTERTLSVTAGSYVGIAYAAQLFDLSLHDRVGNRDWINPVTGEKHSTSLWMHHTMSHERFRDSTSQLRMRTTSNTTMLGGDFIQLTTSETGLAYVGLMGGYGTMDTKTTSKVTDQDSKADTDAWGVGVYAGWKANSTGMVGPYVDGWLMFTHASSDVTGGDQDTENVKGQGLSASLEAGWGFMVGSVTTDNGRVANFTIEPHASVTWFGMQYDELHSEVQDVEFEGTNNVRTRLGARAIISEEGNNDFNAFVEANWVHNTQQYGATISGVTVDQSGSRNQAEARLGVDWRITDGISVWGRVGTSVGSDSYSEREGSVGIRYHF